MAFDPRRIALQGIGFAAVSVATQGFLPFDPIVAPEPPALIGATGGGQVSMSEWLRRYGSRQPGDASEAADLGQMERERRARARKRRRLHEEEILLKRS